MYPPARLRPANDEASRWSYFIGDLKHPKEKLWWQCLDIYKSGYCGTSIIVPLWGQITDPFVIHFMTLYALSIVVRYLPLLWHEIEDGSLDHIRALIDIILPLWTMCFFKLPSNELRAVA
jgi:hypothetical protein